MNRGVHPSDRTSPLGSHPLGWAVYLATSWTWVIGMFLPVLLLRDFGPLGWVVFAVPNVVGAAAMGWVVRSANASQDFVTRHATAVRAFSLVTVVFQVYAASWLLPRLVGPIGGAAMALLLTGGAFAATLPRTWPGVRLAWGAYVVSWAAVVGFGTSRGFAEPSTEGWSPVAWPDLAGLALASVFGFGLCPYLDATFHRARRGAGEGARVAFGVGFGVFFLAMILFTLGYATVMAAPLVGSAVAWVLAIHLTTQAGVTAALHTRELDLHPPHAGRWGYGLLLLGLLLLTLAAGPTVLASSGPLPGVTIGGGEVVYRLFMTFYGLIFPAYVWVVARRPDLPIALYVWAVLLALPFYAVAFLWRQEAWVGVGLAIVVSAGAWPRSEARGDSSVRRL